MKQARLILYQDFPVAHTDKECLLLFENHPGFAPAGPQRLGIMLAQPETGGTFGPAGQQKPLAFAEEKRIQKQPATSQDPQRADLFFDVWAAVHSAP